jgi:hypothetical protein
MTREQALLCPARVRGFSLTEKTWAFFLVEKVQEIKWSLNAFPTLELEEDIKETIVALVETHGNPAKTYVDPAKTHGDPAKTYKEFDDVIAGKGRGLVFLLTGHPGLGKSLTAGTF